MGISLGIGSQLHAILLLTMLGVLGVCFIFMMRKNWRVWTRWAMVFLILIILNTGQIINERQTDYANSRKFLSSFNDKSDNSGGSRFFRNLQLNITCNAQANTLIAGAFGNKENCDFLYSKARNVKPGSRLQLPSDPLSFFGILLSLFFSVFGYSLLVYQTWKEKDVKRKYFTGVILLYAIVSFAVMLPIIDQAPLRYYIHVTFLPFIMIGLMLNYLAEKYPKKNLFIAIAMIAVLALSNLFAIYVEAYKLSTQTRSDEGFVVLDEVQPLVDFIASKTPRQGEFYLFGGSKYYPTYNKTFIYLTSEKGLRLMRGVDINNIPKNAPAFYVGPSLDDNQANEIKGMSFSDHLDVGRLGIYKLQQ